MSKISLSEKLKLRKLKAAVATSQPSQNLTPNSKEGNKKSVKNPTELMASNLLGEKIKGKSKIKLQLQGQKSLVKKCSDKETKKPIQTAPLKTAVTPKPEVVNKVMTAVIAPVIFLQDNLIRTSLHIDLNALHLDTTNNDNSIDFDSEACQKLYDKKINFYVEASMNPMPDILEEVVSGCCVKRYLPKGHSPFLQAMFITAKGKSVFEHAITYEQILKILDRGMSKLSRVSGNLKTQQIEKLKIRHVEGEHFSYYVSK